MRTAKSLTFLLIFILMASCGTKDPGGIKQLFKKRASVTEYHMPLDKGFSEYITGYTSGTISVNSFIEIRFTREFAELINKKNTSGLFAFQPSIKGKAEWADPTTLIFKPSRLLASGTIYTGRLNLHKLTDVDERLKMFPLRIQTLKKDFVVKTSTLECTSPEGTRYDLKGEIIASDYMVSSEIETFLEAKIGRKKMGIVWDHSDMLIHKFTVTNIERTGKAQKLEITWNGTSAGIKQKGSSVITIPSLDEFIVIDYLVTRGETQKIDIVFSDPIDTRQETEGLIWFSPHYELTLSINSNIISLFPALTLSGITELNIEPSIRNTGGATLSASFIQKIDFNPVLPAIDPTGSGVIIPSSQNLIFPFKVANLEAVDLKIIKIFENNLFYFLQENDINTGYSVKRFGRPVYSGRVDLAAGSASARDSWNLYSIDLSDYINVEPGILYRVELGMRPSYSLYSCSGRTDESKYEQLLVLSDEKNREFWEDPDNYYDDSDDFLYYSMGFDWRDRNDPCKDAYFSPDKKVTRNILASNFGLIAKKGPDNNLRVFVNDLITALPLSEVNVDVYDFQMQLVVSGKTDKKGAVSLLCDRKPFLVIAEKDKDRNFLKINDGASLSLSSFDVSGTKPENGIKAFIYGERDVWRPGDSVFLSVFIRDLYSDLPEGHPVHFELNNPLEQKIDYQVQTLAGSNLLVFRTKTTPDAVTGNYNAVVRVGGAVFSKRVRIETVKPNRLKISLNFPDEILGNKPSTGSLNARWLNGATAGNMRASVDYMLKHTKTEFEKYRQYIFDDPSIDFYSETVNVFDGTTNANGNAVINLDPATDMIAPGMLNAVFTARVAEKGGDESIAQTTYKYAPYPAFVGMNLPSLQGKSRMLFTDTNNEIKLVTVDESGRPVNSKVEITLYKISYRWWWESDQENLAYYISNNIYKPVIRQTITSSGGEGSFTFKIDKKEWGRYLIRASLPGGHSTGKIVLVDWPWEYGMKGKSEGATLLAISTDKEKYNPGDEIKLSFPAPENSRAIITLENATGILDEIRTASTGGNSVVSFKARPEMAPNVYAYVTVIQPHAQTVNDMPIRLYGVSPVMVEDPGTRLSPKISMPDETGSQRSFEIRVSEADRKPMSYTLAIVDEGLLDITGFKTPDPWNYFYAREALGVQTWDLYDYVLGTFGGTLERIFAIGGDEAVIDRTADKARRFIPVVRFIGPFRLGAGKTATHTITLSQYTGSVRAMVIAGNNRAFGTAEKSMIVKDPLMVLVTAPRVVSPGEKVALPVTLFVQREDIKNLTVNAEGNNLINFTEKSRSLTVQSVGETDIEFEFTAAEKTGTGTIKVTASGAGESASYDLEIDVRSPNPPETRAEMKVLKQGDQWKTTFSPFGIEGSNTALLEISALPSVNLEKRIDYLVNFPHGCTEQIVSAAFPQIWLKEITGADAVITQNASSNIREAINKLVTRQMNNGGIVLWPEAMQPDNWVTSYAGHFFTEAERAGYVIPASLKQKWINYQKRTTREWRYDTRFRQSANDQAYRLFTLAIAGEPERGAMNRLRESGGIPQLSRWLLAASFAVSGRPEVAEDLLDLRKIETEPEYQGYYYGSFIRDKAIILYTLTILKKEEEALPLFKIICDNLAGGSWYSTQSLAWSLLSYMKYAELIPGDKTSPAKINMILNGDRTDHSISAKQILSKELRMIGGNNSLTIENISDRPVYVNLLRKGIPLTSDMTRDEKGLIMKVDYVSMDLQPVDHKNLLQGTDFMMVARVTNNTFTRVDNIALTQMVPSGWEIRNTRLFEANQAIRENAYDYRDFRDDRVNTYFSLGSGETKTFILILNAAYKGEFFQPSIWCEAMYTDNCYSRYPGNIVKVTGL